MAKDAVDTKTAFCFLNSTISDAQFRLSCDAVLSEHTQPDPSSLLTILIHDDRSKPYIALPNGDQFFWYFAFGSMMNPISLYLRDLTPLMSYPATCFGYRLVFRGTDGMADIELSESFDFDGVVHLMTSENIHRLDVVEDSYHRVELTVTDYQNKAHHVYAYKMIVTSPIAFPSERYLDVIVKGCEYFGVRSCYIDRLRFHEPVVPRKSPTTYQSINDVPEGTFYTYEELARHDGNNPDLPLWISVNGKILQHIGLPSIDHPDYERQNLYYKFYQSEWGGREIAHLFSKAIYEPLYKLAINEQDLCNEHRAMIEDNCIGWMDLNSKASCWKPIGQLITAVRSDGSI